MNTTAAQVLVVSPDNAVLQLAQRCVVPIGHVPILARGLRQAQDRLTRTWADLICLDSVLPAREVERFWGWLRDAKRQATPGLLVLAPKRLTPAGLPGFFQHGRDGLVTKPVESAELTREVSRLLSGRPLEDPARPSELLQMGSLTLDCVTRELHVPGGGSLRLTPTEFRLVRYLMERPGEVVSPEELLQQVWGHLPGTGGPELVRAHVSNLRRKLRESGESPSLVRTIPYQGYGVVDDDVATAS